MICKSGDLECVRASLPQRNEKDGLATNNTCACRACEAHPDFDQVLLSHRKLPSIRVGTIDPHCLRHQILKSSLSRAGKGRGRQLAPSTAAVAIKSHACPGTWVLTPPWSGSAPVHSARNLYVIGTSSHCLRPAQERP